MGSSIVTMFVVVITMAILIQMIVAPSTSSDEEIGGVLRTEVRKLLNQEENVDKIIDIFTKAKSSTIEAKNQVIQYSKENIPQNLKKLLEHIADAPYDIYKKMEPMLNDIPLTSSVEKIGGVLKTEVRKLLNQQENFDKIMDVFAKAKSSTIEAKNQVIQYSKEDIPQNLKKLLEHIADAPYDIYKKMEPMLNDIPFYSSAEKIGGVLKTEVRKLLNQQENFDKIVGIFATAKRSATEAKDEIIRYLQEDLPQNLKKLLEHIADSPYEMYKKMEPMLNDISEKAKQLDKTLESESLAYRMFGKPVWGIVSGIGYLSFSALEFIINSLASLAQIFSQGAKESVNAYNGGKLPDGRIKQAFDTIDDGLGKVKGWGNKIGDHARDRLRYIDTNKVPGSDVNEKDKVAANSEKVPVTERT